MSSNSTPYSGVSLERALFEGDRVRLTNKQQKAAIDIGELIIEKFQKFCLTPHALCIVETVRNEQLDVAITSAPGRGINVGSWNDIFKPKNPKLFILNMGHRAIDTRELSPETMAAVRDLKPPNGGWHPLGQEFGEGSKWLHGDIGIDGTVQNNFGIHDWRAENGPIVVTTRKCNVTNVPNSFAPTVFLSTAVPVA